MAAPVFEEFDPESDCECLGCTHWRLVLPHSAATGLGGHPAARRALVLAAVAFLVGMASNASRPAVQAMMADIV
ncbi:hypothetical protein O3Q52_53975, partial [Streptomyces sp. ActVer]|nr:hypothetical protein [Streptomyces sp. ActVer]